MAPSVFYGFLLFGRGLAWLVLRRHSTVKIALGRIGYLDGGHGNHRGGEQQIDIFAGRWHGGIWMCGAISGAGDVARGDLSERCGLAGRVIFQRGRAGWVGAAVVDWDYSHANQFVACGISGAAGGERVYGDAGNAS